MNHLTEEELAEAYYARLRPLHLKECAECRAAFDRLHDFLNGVRAYPVPERGPAYGAEVWTRLLPQLPAAKPRRPWLRWWTLAPALAMLLVIAFFAGMLMQQRRQQPGFSVNARERVLLAALSRHFERSQIVLAQIANATPATLDLTAERDRARDLVEENRLLRETAARAGDRADAVLLDELERVLLEVANSPQNLSPEGLDRLQRGVDGEGLLFKLRITTSDDRFKGQKL